VFSTDNIKIIFADESVGNGASTSVISYTFAEGNLAPLPEYSFSKKSSDDLRVMAHNVEFDGFFKDENKPAFDRLYDVIEPDIIGFSEIYDHSASDLVNRLEEMLPSPAGKSWNAANIHDNFVATRYTIKNSWPAGESFGNGVFLLDLRPDYSTDALVVVAHPPCCDNDAARQDEIDAIMSFIREAKEPGGQVTLNDSTPIIIMGDMNLVGDPQQVTTLITGDIVNESTYGNDFAADWNDDDFIDSKPFVTGLPMTFTQGIGSYPGAFSKGRLDYMVYSGSVLDLQNSFVLYTNKLPQSVLENNGLLAGDTEAASDHFPLVSDFKLNTSSGTSYTIASTRQNDAEGRPDLNGSTITVSGTVTVAQEFGNTGPAFIQSSATGVAVYGEELISGLQIGDNITITSPVGFLNGLTEFVYDEGSSNVSINTSGSNSEPVRVTIDQVLNQDWDGYELYEGLLVEIVGITLEGSGAFQSGMNYQISDGQSSMDLRVDNEVDLSGVEVPEEEFTVVGVISQYDTSSPYSDGYVIFPRFTEDIKIKETSSIAEIRVNDGTGVPELLNEVVTVSGVITVNDEFGDRGPRYMQDATGGMAIYGSGFAGQFSMGDSITITSKLVQYAGLTEFSYDASTTVVTVHKSGITKEPKTVTIQDILNQTWDGLEEYEGHLVEIQGVTIDGSGVFSGGSSYTISDGQHSMQLWINESVNLVEAEIPEDKFSVIGVISQFDNSSPYSEGYSINPRFVGDIQEEGVTTPSTIADIRVNDGTGVPELLNEVATVSGVITVNDEFGDTGPRFMQDETGGMAIFGSDFAGKFSMGDSITITSKLVQYAGLTEFVYDASTTVVTVHESNISIQPEAVTIEDVLNQSWDGMEQYEGVLIKIENATIAETGAFEGSTDYTLSDATGNIALRIDDDINLVGQDIHDGEMSVTAIVSQYDSNAPYSDGYQLMPRKMGDIVEIEVVKSIELLSPNEGDEFTKGDSISISWTSENVSSINILYLSDDSDVETMIVQNVDASLGQYSEWTAPENIDKLSVMVRDADDDNVYDQSGIFYLRMGTDIEESWIPYTFILYNNYPNPFNPSTKITFSIPEAAEVELAVFDLLGRRIETLINGKLTSGMHSINFDGAGLASGVYIYRLVAGGTSITRKMVLNK
jgi:hypothetical protein